MAKKNWYVEAKKSDDPTVKDLLTQYETLDANAPDIKEKQESLKQEIRAKLGLVEGVAPAADGDAQPETATPEQTTETSADGADDSAEPTGDDSGDSDTPDDTDTPKTPAADGDAQPETAKFSRTEEEAKKATSLDELDKIIKDCREEAARLEKTRLKHATYKQNVELSRKIHAVNRIKSIARDRIAGLKERAHRLAKMGRTTNVAIKRARFVKLWRQGISITNITKHSEGVAKKDLESVLDAATIEACRKHNSKFPEMWAKWKEKFLTEKKRLTQPREIKHNTARAQGCRRPRICD